MTGFARSFVTCTRVSLFSSYKAAVGKPNALSVPTSLIQWGSLHRKNAERAGWLACVGLSSLWKKLFFSALFFKGGRGDLMFTDYLGFPTRISFPGEGFFCQESHFRSNEQVNSTPLDCEGR